MKKDMICINCPRGCRLTVSSADNKIFDDCSIRVKQEVFHSKEDSIQEHFDKYANPTIPPVWKTLDVVFKDIL